MSIKYYRLAKGETPPEEFCAVRDVGGEPSEYVFYVPESDVAKLRELVHDFLYEHADYIAEGNYSIGDLDLEHAMHHNQSYFTREAKKLGIEVD